MHFTCSLQNGRQKKAAAWNDRAIKGDEAPRCLWKGKASDPTAIICPKLELWRAELPLKRKPKESKQKFIAAVLMSLHVTPGWRLAQTLDHWKKFQVVINYHLITGGDLAEVSSSDIKLIQLLTLKLQVGPLPGPDGTLMRACRNRVPLGSRGHNCRVNANFNPNKYSS